MSTQSNDLDSGPLRTLGAFLSCFLAPHTYQQVAQARDWSRILCWEPRLVLERLIASGLLEPAEPDQPLEKRLEGLTIPDLQAASTERDLRFPQAKQDLIAQLVLWDRQGMEQFAHLRTLLQCTEEGARIAHSYQADHAASQA